MPFGYKFRQKGMITLTPKKRKKEPLPIYRELEERRFLYKYELAIEEIQQHIAAAQAQVSRQCGREVVEFQCSRIKSPDSIVRKLTKKGYPVSVKKAAEKLNDIAGVRVVCDYMDDIYALRKLLLKTDDLVLIKEKDFIKSPKKSGYRSLHLIFDVPVVLNKKQEAVRVEVQLRTVIMDFWARLDHQTRYKHNTVNVKEAFHELNECAQIGEAMDKKMLKTRRLIETSCTPSA